MSRLFKGNCSSVKYSWISLLLLLLFVSLLQVESSTDSAFLGFSTNQVADINVNSFDLLDFPIVGSFSCPAFTATNTSSARQNTVACSFTACGGSSVAVSACNCTGDSYLRFYQGNTTVVKNDDDQDTCGDDFDLCSALTYVVPVTSTSCLTYTLNQGCYDDNTCGATTTVTISTPMPTTSPSPAPSQIPTQSPSSPPSHAPSESPSVAPSLYPSADPSVAPSAVPTISVAPSDAPSLSPTEIPTISPSQAPSWMPSETPSQQPTVAPTMAPSQAPTRSPSQAPSWMPSETPSQLPTVTPTLAPSQSPTRSPSQAPSWMPSETPSQQPTVTPTMAPSEAPTVSPSATPSLAPTLSPTAAPTVAPSGVPTAGPSQSPSAAPSLVPTAVPSQAPSLAPSEAPSVAPSHGPTTQPTIAPSFLPSQMPTAAPSEVPTLDPSQMPTLVPTAAPSVSPSLAPSAMPTGSTVPSAVPSVMPSAVPSAMPSALPSRTPSAAPSGVPSTSPSAVPSVVPTAMPSAVPTVQPSTRPTLQPSFQPTAPPTASFQGIAVNQPMVIKFVKKGGAVDGRRLALDQLDGSSRNALIAAAALVLGLQMSAVNIVDEYLVDTNSTSGLSRIGVVFRFLVQDSDFSQQSFASPTALFTFVTNSFAQSLSDATFKTALDSAAAQFQASELMEQNAQLDSTVTVAPPAFTAVDTRYEEDNISKGEYAGIVIGVLVAFIVLGAIVFFLFKRRDEESAQHSAVSTSQV